MNRRAMLAGVGAAATGVMAGCLDAFGSDQTPAPTHHLEVTVQNAHDQPYDVRVSLVDADGTTVVDWSATLTPGEGRGFSDDVGAGDYTLTVTLVDRTRLVSNWNTDQCDSYVVRTTVEADGRVVDEVACLGEDEPIPG